MSFLKSICLLALCCPLLMSTSHLDSFQEVWQTVKDKHWDLAATGVDWDHLYEVYKPKVVTAETIGEARVIFTNMLAELGQSHFRIIEGGTSEKVAALRNRSYGKATPSFKVAIIGHRLFIVKVETESQAFRLGLTIGTEILKLRNEELTPMIQEVEETFKDHPNKEVYQPEAINSLFTGVQGSTLAISAVIEGSKKDLLVPLVLPKGEYKKLLNLSNLFYTYEAKLLPTNIGYVSFNLFIPDASRTFVNDLKGKFAQTEGLIIDLRGNPGGMGILAVTFANRLIEEKGQRLGQMINPGGTMNFPIFPQKPHYNKPVALLINGGSASTSEILAAGLQDLGRARIFGSKSAGAALPSVIVTLPNGDRFQYAIADYETVKGHHLEGVGVSPDELTPHTLQSMARKEDASLTAAIKWISKQKSGEKNETF